MTNYALPARSKKRSRQKEGKSNECFVPSLKLTRVIEDEKNLS
jgi:hypothetical protein